MSRRPTEPFSASCSQTREEQPGGDKGGLKTTDGYKYTHTVVFFLKHSLKMFRMSLPLSKGSSQPFRGNLLEKTYFTTPGIHMDSFFFF